MVNTKNVTTSTVGEKNCFAKRRSIYVIADHVELVDVFVCSDVDWSPFDVNQLTSCSVDTYTYLWDIR